MKNLIPAYREVERVYKSLGRRRAEFIGADLDIELNRFLRVDKNLVHAPGNSWSQSQIRKDANLDDNIRRYAELWLDGTGYVHNEMATAIQELHNISRMKNNFASPDSIEALNYDELFDTLLGCHAFLELLRFTQGGLPGLRQDFLARNTPVQIKRALAFLLHDAGDIFERAYDVIYNEKYKLGQFGEFCVMELVGWMDPTRPPFNGKSREKSAFPWV